MLAKFTQTVLHEGRMYQKDQVYDIDIKVIEACYPLCISLQEEKKAGAIDIDFHVEKKLFYPIDGYGKLNRFLDATFNPNSKSDYYLFCSTPYVFGTLSPEILMSKKIVLLTMFEGSKLPRQWVYPLMRYCVAIITPSTFCVNLYKKEEKLKGVPVYYLPLFTERFENLKPKRDDILVFGMENAFIQGRQKGWDLLIEAFIELNLPNTKLLLKARKSHYAYNDVRYYDLAKSKKNIEIILDDFTDEEMVEKFYKKIDVFVYPSRGEGFGLPPLQAMGFGIPTILTNGHGMKDFANYGIPVKIKDKNFPVYYVGRVHDNTQNIKWQDVCYEDLKKKMLHVYNNWQSEKDRAIKMIGRLEKKYSKKVFIDGLLKIMNEIQK